MNNLKNLFLKFKRRIKGDNNVINILSKKACNLEINIQGDNNRIEVMDNVLVKKLIINISGSNSLIRISKNTTIESCQINIAESNTIVTIGEDCMISGNVKIYASDYHSIIDLNTGLCTNYSKRGIAIGNHVWIGEGVRILKDSYISDNCIVGTYSLITHDIKDVSNAIFAGNPAKIVKENITWERTVPSLPFYSEFTKIPTNIKTNGKSNIKFLIENKQIINGCLKIMSGWAFIENINSKESKIYIEIKYGKKTSIYTIKSIIRQDVSETFSNDKKYYANSGFYANISENIKIEKIVSVNIIILNNNTLFSQKIL